VEDSSFLIEGKVDLYQEIAFENAPNPFASNEPQFYKTDQNNETFLDEEAQALL